MKICSVFFSPLKNLSDPCLLYAFLWRPCLRWHFRSVMKSIILLSLKPSLMLKPRSLPLGKSRGHGVDATPPTTKETPPPSFQGRAYFIVVYTGGECGCLKTFVPFCGALKNRRMLLIWPALICQWPELLQSTKQMKWESPLSRVIKQWSGVSTDWKLSDQHEGCRILY